VSTDIENMEAMLTRLKLTAIREQLDSLLDEAARRELTLREALAYLCEVEIARKDQRRTAMGTKFCVRRRLVVSLGQSPFEVDRELVQGLVPLAVASHRPLPLMA